MGGCCSTILRKRESLYQYKLDAREQISSERKLRHLRIVTPSRLEENLPAIISFLTFEGEHQLLKS